MQKVVWQFVACCVVMLSQLICEVVCAEESLASASSITEQVRKFGTKRGPAPRGWAGLPWDEKRQVLFGQFGPSDDEKVLIAESVSALKIVKPAQPRKVLVFYQCQYPHASIATGTLAFEQIGKVTGAYEATLSDDPGDISIENLAQYDALLLNNTTDFDVTVGSNGQKAILDFVRGDDDRPGKGLIGIHAAADSCKSWKLGQPLINGVFRCHPWLPKGTWAFQLESPSHPLNAAFDKTGFWFRDEIYVYRDGTHSRTKSRVLVSLDMSKAHNRESSDLHPKQKDLAQTDDVRPVAWIHPFGEGRVFYSNFGHNNTTYWQPRVLQHYVDGIQYALGDIEADATPSSELGDIEYALAPEQVSSPQ